MADIFEPIIDGGIVEGWVQETLEDWFPVYLPELETQRGITAGTYPAPRSFTITETPDKDPSDQLPAVVVVSPGLSGDEPLQEGDGSVRAWWHVGVGVFVSASDKDSTRIMGRIYCAAARAILLQHRSLGKRAANTMWVDESYDDDFNFLDRATITFGQAVFKVEVDGVVNTQAGPTTLPDPVTQPGQGWPTADVVEIDEIRKEPLFG